MTKVSPLDASHRELGAKLVDFGGWNMPVSYPSGTIAEHQACRTGAAVFDVSHLGTVRVTGDTAFGTLQSTLTNDLSRIAPGRAQYTHLLDESGSVVDDLIVWWVDEDRFDVMPNASNTDPVTSAIGGVDVTAERAVLAVQGSTARSLVATVFPEAAEVARFDVRSLAWRGTETTVAGTGYTGEDGIEIAVPVDVAPDLWDAVLAAGVTPAGLGARDTLRLEAGLPLHGHELGLGITPLQAGLGWVVGWKKPTFRGRAALEAERAAGPARRLRALRCEGRQPPRSGNEIFIDGVAAGTVTSGNYSPVLGCGIALGFLSPDVALGSHVTIDVRGRAVGAEVIQPPFVTPGSA